MPVVDRLYRPLKDLRISVTDRCNFRCSYCMPKEIFGQDYPFLKREEILSFEEIIRVAKVASTLGVEKIRLTGGEPLLRKGVSELISQLNRIEGIRYITLTTNGVYLEKYAEQLKQAGICRVNVSLDSLDPEIFKQINDMNIGPEPVLKGILRAKETGLEVKVNMVVKKGVNESQVLPMVQFFKEKEIALRFIEFMDVGSTNGWDLKDVLTKKELHSIISEKYPIEPVNPTYFGEVAKRYRYVGSSSEVGFISSVSETFCSSCTRARLSTDGKIYTCLFASEGFDLKSLLRSSVDDSELKQVLMDVWNKREDRYSELRTEKSEKRKKIEMSYIGG
ncbi:GTP 3',8-cyclase MoaA [Bacillus carboniphilus]|uniref:GTP 3',8-cyclase n=1 Tax=Bacillus carboniphilus TaxID=86663 RepID=A0ABY9JSK6_9BACI|nr:GTP 3',8-cyclase MoaA [Bacillus carboniphilus]WLR42382.1 GTP 3',8-cyclase MoaA [Bacillus carboniphilus]